jgi:hypothetical protein
LRLKQWVGIQQNIHKEWGELFDGDVPLAMNGMPKFQIESKALVVRFAIAGRYTEIRILSFTNSQTSPFRHMDGILKNSLLLRRGKCIGSVNKAMNTVYP